MKNRSFVPTLADEPRTFARDVVHLLRDAGRRAQLETAARALVLERYDWSAVAGALEGALIAVADRGPRTADSLVIMNPNLKSEIRNLKSQGDTL